VVVAASCNFLEMYDFMVFGYFAKAIGEAYFPASSEFASLMLVFATFGAGFLMRPLGAIVLGTYIDRHGRRPGLLLTLGLMAAGTLSIAAMPRYKEVGIVAPIVVVLGRLLQGLSAGATVGGVSIYLGEIAKAGSEGFYVSWQSASQQVAVMLASSVGIALGYLLPADAVLAWGWRIPFYLGCLLIPALFWMQRAIEETPAFLNRDRRPEFRDLLRSMFVSRRIIVAGAGLVIMTTVSFYLITAYTPTFGTSVLHLPARQSLTVSLCIGMSNFILLPLMGALSDKLGRRPLLIVATITAIVTGYPAMIWMTNHPTFSRFLVVELWLSLIYSCYNGVTIVYLTKIMPFKVKTAAAALAYSMAVAVFGGFTPAICTWMIHVSGSRASPGIWLTSAALLSFIAIVSLPRSADAG
jgi:MFS family permease